jgi:hypothetical protein
VVLSIFQNTFRHGSSTPNSHGILSCFTRDSLADSIYVEAQLLPAVVKILQGISGVARSSSNGPPIVKAIDVQERPLLLSMEQSTIRVPSLVWIKAGLYKGDLALVRDLDTSSQLCEVYLVPHLA